MDEARVAFITGGNRGIGLETARELGMHGVRIVLGSRNLEKGEAAAEELSREGIAAEAIRFDIVLDEDHQRVFDFFQEKYRRLDILVNNAGISPEGGAANFSEWNTTSTVSRQILRETFETNFFSTVALTQRLLPLIKNSPAGRIVNLSSIQGSLTLHADPQSAIYSFKPFAYDASKAALNAFTVHLAHELRYTEIKVNSAHPGWVKTELGGELALMDVCEGGKTSAQLAMIGPDGPTGGFFFLGKTLPW